MNSAPQVIPKNPPPHGPFASLRAKLPAAEVVRFLMVGGVNTLFALGLAYVLVRPFALLLPHANLGFVVLLAQVVSTPFAITFSFLGYKWFVFRTHGNYLREWLRCFAVYGVGVPVSLVILPIATNLFLLEPLTRPYAKILALIVNSICIACYSYFAHKKFSFKR
jgi:putative flippase GtrA